MTYLILFPVCILAVAAAILIISHRYFHREIDGLKSRLKEAANRNILLQEEIRCTKTTDGVSQATVLLLAGEIARIENNLLHMDEVPGRKQIMKAIERMKGAFQAEEYTIVPLLGHPYVEGMKANAVFVPDDTLEEGASIIQSVQCPQVNHRGKMIQAASITVGQNIE